MDQYHLNNFGRGPPKDHLCEISSKLGQGFRWNCRLSQKLTKGQTTDGQRTKTDHKSSPCHFVTGELKTVYTPAHMCLLMQNNILYLLTVFCSQRIAHQLTCILHLLDYTLTHMCMDFPLLSCWPTCIICWWIIANITEAQQEVSWKSTLRGLREDGIARKDCRQIEGHWTIHLR